MLHFWKKVLFFFVTSPKATYGTIPTIFVNDSKGPFCGLLWNVRHPSLPACAFISPVVTLKKTYASHLDFNSSIRALVMRFSLSTN